MEQPGLLIASCFRTKPRVFLISVVSILALLTLWTFQSLDSRQTSATLHTPTKVYDPIHEEAYLASASQMADYMISYPLDKSQFGQMGKRLQILKTWIRYTESTSLDETAKQAWLNIIERVAVSAVPFLNGPGFRDSRALEDLRKSFVPGSKGLVIVAGKKQFRYACHLILNIRDVLKSTLPIQIAYSGEEDLPEPYRNFAKALSSNIETFDVTSVFDDSTLELGTGGWASKVFSLLGSTFEQAILLDADTVFLQKPDILFNEHPKYAATGTMLFHDRLLWQGAFRERHAWWEKELAHTTLSETIKQSKVYMENYAEEGDSGVVAVDKSRLDVLIGLLHIAWQNTKEVRESYTYVQGYGDKESWWFGFELAATPYSMEQHYAAITGHVKVGADHMPENRVCSFTIAHVDHQGKPLWWNGSLLKNKQRSATEFDIPMEWMIDGTWEKGAEKQDMSCMADGQVMNIDEATVDIVRQTVNLAEHLDNRLRVEIPSIEF